MHLSGESEAGGPGRCFLRTGKQWRGRRGRGPIPDGGRAGGPGLSGGKAGEDDPRLPGDGESSPEGGRRAGGLCAGRRFCLLVSGVRRDGGRSVRYRAQYASLGGSLHRRADDEHLPVPVVAVDIASGVEADTGRILGVAVEADETVTFTCRRRGMFWGRGDCAADV